jgi:hypothetical protein
MDEVKTPEVVVPPTTMKVGDKEYTPEQIVELEKAAAEKDEVTNNYKSLQSDYSKKAEKAKLYDELQAKADDVIKGDVSASDMTAQEIEDLKYMSKLGFVPQKKLDEVIAKVKEETTKEVEEKLTRKEKLAQVEKEIDVLAGQHTFIVKDDLKKYMSDRAQNGTVLTPEDAVTLLYKDQILANGIKPEDLPGAAKVDKGKIEEPKAKILDLGSRAMNERMRERLTSIN